MRLLWRLAESFVLLVVIFNVVLYARRARALRRAACHEEAGPPGWGSAVWAFGQECAASAAVLLLIPAGWWQPCCRHGAGTRGAIVLVHGREVSRGALWWLRRRLLRDGWSPVCCVAVRATTTDVERAASQLHEVIERLQVPALPPTPVTLIGHSVGGLAARYFARRYAAPRVRRIVTLGTPHQGTESGPLCDWCARAIGRRLAPESSLLRRLNAADHVAQQFDVIAISSTFDARILPPSNALYPGAFNVQLNNVGHYTLLFSPAVYRLLAENLAAPLR